MKDKSIRPGTKISCIIEQVGDNFIYLLYRHGGNTYRGLLLNEDCSAVRRVIPDGYYPKKAILDQATTDNLQNAITNHALDTQSKGLRSKKLKQACIVLDDYELSAIGKSPIDSIRGLVESIDTNISLSKPPSNRTFSPSPAQNQSPQLKEVVISPLKNLHKSDSKTKVKDDFGRTRRQQIYRKRITEVHFKAAPFDSRGIPAERKSSNYFNRRLAELNISQKKRPSGFSLLGARSSFSPTKFKASVKEKVVGKVETVTIPEVQEKPLTNVATSASPKRGKRSLHDVVQQISSEKSDESVRRVSNEYMTRTKRHLLNESTLSPKQKRKRKSLPDRDDVEMPNEKTVRFENYKTDRISKRESDSNASTPTTPTKRRHKKTRRITMKKRRKIPLVTDLPTDSYREISEKSKKTMDKQPAASLKPRQKRVDPVLIALKNIKKYESYRRRKNRANAENMENYKLLTKPRKLRSGKKLSSRLTRSELPSKSKKYRPSKYKSMKDKADESADSSDSDISTAPEESDVSQITNVTEEAEERGKPVPDESNVSRVPEQSNIPSVSEETSKITDNKEKSAQDEKLLKIKNENPVIHETSDKVPDGIDVKNANEVSLPVTSCDIIFPRNSLMESGAASSSGKANENNPGASLLMSSSSQVDRNNIASIQGATTSLLGPYILLPDAILQKASVAALSNRTLPLTSSSLTNSSLSAIAMKVKGTKTTTLNRHPLPHTKKRLIKTEIRKQSSISSVNKVKNTPVDYFTKKPEIMRNRPSIFGAKGMYTPAPEKHVYESDSEKEDKPIGELDLVCHEKSLSPDDVKPVPVVKKNRRKPLQVFKSLPNPAAIVEKKSPVKSREETNLECEETLDEDIPQSIHEEIDTHDDKKDIVKKIKKKKHKSQKVEPINAVQLLSQQNEKMLTRKQFSTYMTSHNTRFRGKKSVVPCLNISPVRIKKLSQEKPLLISKNLRLNFSDKIKENQLDESAGPSSPSASVVSFVTDNEDDTSDIVRSSTSRKILFKKKKINKFRETFKNIKPLTRKNHEVRLGDIVWGRCPGHGWWPGLVVSIDSTHKDNRIAQTTWFNSNTQSYMSLVDVKLFTLFFDKLFKPKKSATYTKAVWDALKACENKYGVLAPEHTRNA